MKTGKHENNKLTFPNFNKNVAMFNTKNWTNFLFFNFHLIQ